MCAELLGVLLPTTYLAPPQPYLRVLSGGVDFLPARLFPVLSSATAVAR